MILNRTTNISKLTCSKGSSWLSLLMSISAKGHCQGPSCSGQKLRSHPRLSLLSSSHLQPSTQAQQSMVRVTGMRIAATTYKLVSLQNWPLFKPPEAVLGNSLSRADRTVLGTCSQLSQSQVHQGWGLCPCTALSLATCGCLYLNNLNKIKKLTQFLNLTGHISSAH